MRSGIFVTGGSGFVGRSLLAALRHEDRPVVALMRGELSAHAQAGITVVHGDVLNPLTYRDALGSCDVVIHMAAATGRASAEEHTRVNARGTEVLLEACRSTGVPKVLFVSSIAATFLDRTGYHYAEAKLLAEEAVSGSGLRSTIVRPTIITGAGAPVLTGLEKLALLPMIVLPGHGRVKVQPIHVDNVVEFLIETVRQDRFNNEVVELGGPEVLTIEALLQQLRVARGRGTGRVLHVPLGLLRVPLRVAEAMGLDRLMPITAGQLSSFRFDGVASTTPRRPGPLDAECLVFTRHLLHCDPDGYVIDQYTRAHAVLPALAPISRLDQLLVAFARRGPRCTRIADAYASLLFRGAVLRKRLVLLLAILETRPPFHHTIDTTVGGSMPVLLARLALKAAGAVVHLIAGAVIFVPARVVMSFLGNGPGKAVR